MQHGHSLLFGLQYFVQVYGKTVIAVDPEYTSQDCSACGNTVKKTLSTRTHICGCGAVLDRGHNAGRNILATRVEVSRNHFKYGGAHRN